MGLSSALDLLEDGHQVTVFEAADVPGGLAGSFDFGGVRTEKYYHFICGADTAYFRWLRRLKLSDRLRWTHTSMGHFEAGNLHDFGGPISLLQFSPLKLYSRLRYGFHVWNASRLPNWKELENISARDWLIQGEGIESYQLIWEPLLRSKFAEATDQISAAWIWSRIHRLASSRNRLFKESLGYIQGGTEVFVNGLVQAVVSAGGTIHCGTPVERIDIASSQVTSLSAGGKEHKTDALVSTLPLPLLLQIASELPEDYRKQASAITNIGVRCIILKLSQPLTQHFWVNINDEEIPLCGLIELTNLHPISAFQNHSIVYSPHYTSSKHPDYQRSSEEVFEETVSSICRIQPDFHRSSIVDYRVFRTPHAQPICTVGFTNQLAPIQTPVSNLVAADTTHLLPHDRSISESLALAEQLTKAVRSWNEAPISSKFS